MNELVPAVAYFEVSATSPSAQKFYADLFERSVPADPAMGGRPSSTPGRDETVTGGIGPFPDGTKICVRIDDLDAYLERAENRVLRLCGMSSGQPIGCTRSWLRRPRTTAPTPAPRDRRGGTTSAG